MISVQLKSILQTAIRSSRHFKGRHHLLQQHIQPNFQLAKNLNKSAGDRVLEESQSSSTEKKLHFKSEEKFFVKTQTDPDVFGSQDDGSSPDQEGDIQEEQYITNPVKKSQKLRTKQYADMIKEHLQFNRIKEATDVLEVRMLKEDRVKPENYIFNLLIGGCARVGYSKKAFQLYNKMKQHGLKVTGGTYTSLFNACANAPWKQDGLNKANRLREIMLEKSYEPNATNYNAMIKAYGRCGDLKTAFLLTDDMIEKNMDITVESFNFLLQACASDKDFGFRHALLVWHKMLRRGLTPDIYSFHNLLRCVRDCSIGDLETTEEVLNELLKFSKKENKEQILLANVSEIEQNQNEIQNTELEVQENVLDTTPNLISNNPNLGSLVSINEIQKPEDRLLLLGGISGFLAEMKKVKVTPGIEVFTTLLEVAPSTIAAEKRIISLIRKIGLKADIDFFNILIKKRSMRFDYDGAKEVLSMIKTAKLYPDIVTYGVLALGCQTEEQARELLQQMYDNELRINIYILGAMLRQGCAQKNFDYIHEIMQIVISENIKPNEIFLKHLDNFQKNCFEMIHDKNSIAKTTKFKQNFNQFKQRLEVWRRQFGIENLKLEDAIKKIKGNPYQQFKEGQPEGYEDIKNEKLQTKRKLRKYISKIKPNSQKNDSPELKQIGSDG